MCVFEFQVILVQICLWNLSSKKREGKKNFLLFQKESSERRGLRAERVGERGQLLTLVPVPPGPLSLCPCHNKGQLCSFDRGLTFLPLHTLDEWHRFTEWTFRRKVDSCAWVNLALLRPNTLTV